MKPQHFLLTIITFLVVITVAMAVSFKVSMANAPKGPPSFPLPVETHVVKSSAWEQRMEAVGTLQSNERVTIRPELTAKLIKIHFDEGQKVKKGDPLFTLDDRIYKAELANAKARLNLAKITYKRNNELKKTGASAQRSLDEAKAALKIAQADVQLAQIRLGQTIITAPFSGMVGLRQVSEGEVVNQGSPLVTLDDASIIKVDFDLPETMLGKVKLKQRVDLSIDAFDQKMFVGEVYAIAPQVDQKGRSIQLRAKLPNDLGDLTPGQFVRVSLILEEKESVYTIPEQALVPTGSETFIYKVVEGKAVLQKVEIGGRSVGWVEIRSGVIEGDQVITSGQIKLRDGAPVSMITDTEQAS